MSSSRRRRPRRVAERAAQRPPLLVGLDRDRAPLVAARARVGVVRRRVGRVVAGAARARARDLTVEQLGGEEVQRRLHLRLIDVLALAGAAAVVERGDQRGGEEARRDGVGVGVERPARAGGRPSR